jgi:hypothetical protein
LEWVISENMIRRHLTSSQRAVLALELLPMLEQEAHKRKRRGPTIRKNLRMVGGDGEARQVAARLVHSNPVYVQAVKNIQSQAPELLDRVRDGILKVPDAARLARLPKAERKGVLRLCDGKPVNASELHDLTRQVKKETRQRAARAFARSSKSASDQGTSTAQKKTKCELGFTGWHDGRWIDDPFPWGLGVSSRGAQQWDLEFGKDYVVWSRAGSYGGSDLAVNTELMHNDAVMLVKCRIEPFGPKRESGCGSRPLEKIPPDGAVAQDSCPATPPMTRWHRASPASRDEGKR